MCVTQTPVRTVDVVKEMELQTAFAANVRQVGPDLCVRQVREVGIKLQQNCGWCVCVVGIQTFIFRTERVCLESLSAGRFLCQRPVWKQLHLQMSSRLDWSSLPET